jgi:hypothetical protein
LLFLPICLQKLRWVLGIQLHEAALAAHGGCQNAFMNAFEDPGFWVVYDLNLELAVVKVSANVDIRNYIF